jgi:hypothetical protein
MQALESIAGLLRCVPRLSLTFPAGVLALRGFRPEARPGAREFVEAVMGVLGRVWRPNPALLSGNGNTNNNQNSGSEGQQVVTAHSSGSSSLGSRHDRRWMLQLDQVYVSHAGLAHLPHGLTHLDIK